MSRSPKGKAGESLEEVAERGVDCAIESPSSVRRREGTGRSMLLERRRAIKLGRGLPKMAVKGQELQ